MFFHIIRLLSGTNFAYLSSHTRICDTYLISCFAYKAMEQQTPFFAQN